MTAPPDRILDGKNYAGFASRLSVHVLDLQTELREHEKAIDKLTKSIDLIQPLLQKLPNLPLVEKPKPELVPEDPAKTPVAAGNPEREPKPKPALVPEDSPKKSTKSSGAANTTKSER